MSGPKTASISFAPAGAAIVAAAALREAYRIVRETQAANDAAEVRDAERQAAELRVREAEATRRLNLRKGAEVAAERFLQQRETIARLLPDLAGSVPTLPAAPPDDTGSGAWQAYLAACETALAHLDRILADTSAQATAQQADHAGQSIAMPALEPTLQAYLIERRRNPALSAVESAFFAETAARILERLDRDLLPVVPPAIAALAREIVLSPDRDRADALASELRLQVKRANDAALAEQQRAEREAAAFVLEASLRDLGYTVDDIAETVFVEGGLVHFQKRGWGDYFVRLRIDATKSSANFNVVRGGAPSEGEVRRADQLAEDRWCAELPRLFETLRARGLALDLQRHVAAGALPVQVVDPASLPAAARDEERIARTPIARERPLS